MVGVPENPGLLDAALQYAAMGWHVLPLHTPTGGGCSCGNPGCQSPGKHPRNDSGSRGASTDPAQIRYWWEERWPEANVGISTGPESNLTIVDADGEAGLSSLQSLSLSSKLSVDTGGGGKQLYYQYLPGVKNSVKKVAPGLDIRGDGGYVVAVPSLHASGKRYSFTGGPVACKLENLSSYPSHILSSAQEASGEPTAVPGLIPLGERNQTLMSIGGSMRRRGLGEDEILAALQAVNQLRCEPRLRDDELRRIAHSSSRYRPEDPIPHRRTGVPRIQVISAFELCNIDLPAQDNLVGPVLVRGNRLVVAGPTGEGKTTFAIQLVKAYLEGSSFLIWGPHKSEEDVPHIPPKVLIVDAEQGVRTISRRILEAGLEKKKSPALDYILVPDGLNLDDPIESNDLEEVIARNRYDVVVLDPLYKLHKGEMTDERVAVELMRHLDSWRERYHFALVLLAHFRKPTPGYPVTLNDVAGSSAVARGAEIILGLQRTGPGTSRLHFFKDRDGDLPVGEQWELDFDRGSGGFSSPMQLLRKQDEGDDSETRNYDNSGYGSNVYDFDSYRPQ